jgi:tetratricopeptide (TPR) repeat protein
LSLIYLGDLLAAQQALHAGEVLAREMDYTGELAMILILSAQVLFYSGGDPAQVKANLAEAESLQIKAFSLWSNAMIEFGFARLASLLGDIQKARALFMQSAETAQRTGNMRLVYSCHSELAHMLRRHGEINEALELYTELLPQWKELGHRSAVAHELECVAFILLQKDLADRALTLLGAAEALRAAIDSTMTQPERVEYEHVISALHAQVDENKSSRRWATGRLMDMNQAIEYALQATDL